MAELLTALDIVAGYGNGPAILDGASLTVTEGRIHCIIGPNGAGKSTLLKTVCGMIPVRSGEITFAGKRLNGLRPDQILRHGLCFVPQERALFPKMTVRENLRMGGYVLRDKAELEKRIDEVLDHFPILRERSSQQAGTMSGGQQQILSMARAMLLRPKLIMLDEPSLGLAPKVIAELYDVIGLLRSEGAAIVIVEQNALMGLKFADWGIVLDLGKTLFEAPSSQVLDDRRMQELYLGKGHRAA